MGGGAVVVVLVAAAAAAVALLLLLPLPPSTQYLGHLWSSGFAHSKHFWPERPRIMTSPRGVPKQSTVELPV